MNIVKVSQLDVSTVHRRNGSQDIYLYVPTNEQRKVTDPMMSIGQMRVTVRKCHAGLNNDYFSSLFLEITSK